MSFNLNLLYHIWSIFSHFPPGSDALFTEGMITVGQDPKDIISWRLLFINIVHADSTGYRHIFPGARGSSRTIVLFFGITGNRLLDTFSPFNYLPKNQENTFSCKRVKYLRYFQVLPQLQRRTVRRVGIFKERKLWMEKEKDGLK